MIRSIVSTAVAGLAGFIATKAVLASRLATRDNVVRTNHAGREVSLIEGPAVTAGLLAGGLLIEDPRQRAASLLATSAAGSLGAVDDFAESGDSKGLRGHLSALARGEVTTGTLKVIGIPLASVAAAAILRTGTPKTGLLGLGRHTDEPSWWSRSSDIIVTGGVIAGTANLFNLLDLRPGRALKAGAITLALTDHERRVSWTPAGAVAGATAAAWPKDLAGETMLGDTGANALGAAIGVILSETATAGQRRLILAVLAGLTLASEKVSFTSVIESTPRTAGDRLLRPRGRVSKLVRVLASTALLVSIITLLHPTRRVPPLVGVLEHRGCRFRRIRLPVGEPRAQHSLRGRRRRRLGRGRHSAVGDPAGEERHGDRRADRLGAADLGDLRDVAVEHPSRGLRSPDRRPADEHRPRQSPSARVDRRLPAHVLPAARPLWHRGCAHGRAAGAPEVPLAGLRAAPVQPRRHRLLHRLRIRRRSRRQLADPHRLARLGHHDQRRRTRPAAGTADALDRI
jgi:UDP-N-acetylmuramyl pentapeptide phosphotransferase/UDP-N-acetylglucosamine-1-phosphate transferase